MKHSNQSTIADTKSSAHSLLHNLLLVYSICSLWLVIVYCNVRPEVSFTTAPAAAGRRGNGR